MPTHDQQMEAEHYSQLLFESSDEDTHTTQGTYEPLDTPLSPKKQNWPKNSLYGVYAGAVFAAGGLALNVRSGALGHSTAIGHPLLLAGGAIMFFAGLMALVANSWKEHVKALLESTCPQGVDRQPNFEDVLDYHTTIDKKMFFRSDPRSIELRLFSASMLTCAALYVIGGEGVPALAHGNSASDALNPKHFSHTSNILLITFVAIAVAAALYAAIQEAKYKYISKEPQRKRRKLPTVETKGTDDSRYESVSRTRSPTPENGNDSRSEERGTARYHAYTHTQSQTSLLPEYAHAPRGVTTKAKANDKQPPQDNSKRQLLREHYDTILRYKSHAGHQHSDAEQEDDRGDRSRAYVDSPAQMHSITHTQAHNGRVAKTVGQKSLKTNKSTTFDTGYRTDEDSLSRDNSTHQLRRKAQPPARDDADADSAHSDSDWNEDSIKDFMDAHTHHKPHSQVREATHSLQHDDPEAKADEQQSLRSRRPHNKSPLPSEDVSLSGDDQFSHEEYGRYKFPAHTTSVPARIGRSQSFPPGPVVDSDYERETSSPNPSDRHLAGMPVYRINQHGDIHTAFHSEAPQSQLPSSSTAPRGISRVGPRTKEHRTSDEKADAFHDPNYYDQENSEKTSINKYALASSFFNRSGAAAAGALTLTVGACGVRNVPTMLAGASLMVLGLLLNAWSEAFKACKNKESNAVHKGGLIAAAAGATAAAATSGFMFSQGSMPSHLLSADMLGLLITTGVMTLGAIVAFVSDKEKTSSIITGQGKLIRTDSDSNFAPQKGMAYTIDR